MSGDPAWVRFDHPEGLFSISHPRRWAQVAPVSKGAALSCLAQDDSVLFEVMCFQKAPGEGALVDAIVEGLVKYAAHEEGMSRGRVIAENSFPFGGAEACTDVLLAYHDEAGVQISIDYFTVGSGRDALYVALKTPTGQFPAELPDFERALGTLKTPWMQANEAPNLSGGGRPRPAGALQIDPQRRAEIHEWLARETAPPPRRSGGCLPWIIAAAVALAGIWYFFLRH
jgi:hypothetical protein